MGFWSKLFGLEEAKGNTIEVEDEPVEIVETVRIPYNVLTYKGYLDFMPLFVKVEDKIYFINSKHMGYHDVYIDVKELCDNVDAYYLSKEKMKMCINYNFLSDNQIITYDKFEIDNPLSRNYFDDAELLCSTKFKELYRSVLGSGKKIDEDLKKAFAITKRVEENKNFNMFYQESIKSNNFSKIDHYYISSECHEHFLSYFVIDTKEKTTFTSTSGSNQDILMKAYLFNHMPKVEPIDEDPRILFADIINNEKINSLKKDIEIIDTNVEKAFLNYTLLNKAFIKNGLDELSKIKTHGDLLNFVSLLKKYSYIYTPSKEDQNHLLNLYNSECKEMVIERINKYLEKN